MSWIVAPAAGLEAGVRELLAQQLERHAVLQRERRGAGEAVHQAADGRAFLGHGDEQLARHAVFVEADGEVAFVSAHVELVGDRQALVGQTMAHGARRRSGSSTASSFPPCPADKAGAAASPWLDLRRGRSHRAERLRLLGAVAVDGDRLQAQLPRLDVGFGDLVHGGDSGMLMVLEIAPEMNGCAAAIMRRCPR